MTPEKLKEIEAKAQELYPTPTKETYPEPDELAYEKIQRFFLRNTYKEGALSLQPELDTLQSENTRLRERIRELEDAIRDIREEIPERPKLPIIHAIKEILDRLLTKPDSTGEGEKGKNICPENFCEEEVHFFGNIWLCDHGHRGVR